MTMRTQRKVASRILKCGTTRVWFDPVRVADIEEAITAQDVRRLIKDNVIKVLPKQGVSSFRKKKIKEQKKKGRRRGPGSVKGHRSGLTKKLWMSRIRSIRTLIKNLRDSEKIEKHIYKDIYVKSKSGFFRNKSHVMTYLERNNLLKK